MTEQTMTLIEYLRKCGSHTDADFRRESVRLMAQLLTEAVVEPRVGAAPHERSPERVN